MKIIKTLFILLMVVMIVPMQAQDMTAEQVVDNYLETIGGADAWANVEGTKRDGVLKMQGLEIPFKEYMFKDGRMAMEIDLSGNVMVWSAYDGETLWQRNQMTMLAEKSDSEATANFVNQMKDFPSPFLNYADKGYTIELLGMDTVDGTECYKIQVTKDPLVVNGEEQENAPIYYFDTENFVPIIEESTIQIGPMTGQKIRSTIGNYQEVEGLYFPFENGSDMQSIVVKDIVLNPEVEDTYFAMPKDN